MLRFPDNTKVAVKGLDEILAQMYTENRKACGEAAKEIVRRLEEEKNFIPSSESVRREYAFVLLEEYRKYIEKRSS